MDWNDTRSKNIYEMINSGKISLRESPTKIHNELHTRISKRNSETKKTTRPYRVDYVKIYGRRFPIHMGQKGNVHYCTFKFNKKWLASASSKEELFVNTKLNLELVFEKCAATGDFSRWTQITGDKSCGSQPLNSSSLTTV